MTCVPSPHAANGRENKMQKIRTPILSADAESRAAEQ
jgi:hypothetical protein